LLATGLFHWKKDGFQPDVGALIATYTKKEILSIIERAGLEEGDYAILTDDPEFSMRGLGAENANRARVLFVTHAKLRYRLAKKSFISASEFYFRGMPRPGRFWDEGLLPALPINISVDELRGLAAALRPYDAPYLDRVATLVRMIDETPGKLLRVPSIFNKLPRGMRGEDAGSSRAPLTPSQTEAIKQLKLAAGRKLLIMNDKCYGMALVGSGPKLPDDLAPLVILDGSASIRQTYKEWDKARGNLVWLPAGQNSYEKVRFNVWKRSSGQTALRAPDELNVILEHVSAVMLLRPKEPWLVVCHKPKPWLKFDLEKTITDLLPKEMEVHFVSWGAHHGINDFRHCKNVVVISAFDQRATTYQARYMAATGKRADQVTGDEHKLIRRSELQDVMMQAVNRGHCRVAPGGIAGQCTVHMVVSGSPEPMTMLEETFPGAIIQPWEPVLPNLRGKPLQLVELLTRLKVEKQVMIAKGRARALLGMDDETRFAQVMGNPKVKTHLKALGIRTEHKTIWFDDQPALAA